MIVRTSRERYEGGHRIVTYEPDGTGRVAPRVIKSAFDENIDSYFDQQDHRLRSLEAKVLAGEISPVALYMALFRMTPEAAAPRLRLRKSVVRAHMTPDGFDRATVEVLRRYAQIFDVTVADFFQFIHLDDDLDVEVERAAGGALQKVTVSRER